MKRFVLVSLVALALAACGDDKADQSNDLLTGRGNEGGTMFPGGVPSGLPTGLPPGANPLDPTTAMPDMGKIELTDEVMERYVKLLKEMKAKEVDSPGEALLATYSLDWRTLGVITSTIARSKAAAHMPESSAAIEKALADAKERAKNATDPTMKSMYEGQVKMFETQLANQKAMPQPTDLDRKNHEVIKRWEKRLEEAGK